MGRKLNYEAVRAEFADAGCELLESEYRTAQTSMRYKCHCGEDSQTCLNGFRRAPGCRRCQSWNNERKYDLNEVVAIFATAGCTLHTQEYQNNNQVLEYTCVCGTRTTTRLREFLRGVRCQSCKFSKLAQEYRLTIEQVRKEFELQGCSLLSGVYVDNRTKLIFLCRCGREGVAALVNFRQYPNCRACGIEKKAGSNCYRWNPDREVVALRLKYAKACSRMLRRCLKKLGHKKRDRTHVLLGYTYQELQKHIQSHPDYPGDGVEFHIDHIFPIKAFLDHGIHDLRLINALGNLRPMPGPENQSKGGEYDKIAFQAWLSSKYEESACK